MESKVRKHPNENHANRNTQGSLLDQAHRPGCDRPDDPDGIPTGDGQPDGGLAISQRVGRLDLGQVGRDDLQDDHDRGRSTRAQQAPDRTGSVQSGRDQKEILHRPL